MSSTIPTNSPAASKSSIPSSTPSSISITTIAHTEPLPEKTPAQDLARRSEMDATVSHVLNPHTHLTRSSAFLYTHPALGGRPSGRRFYFRRSLTAPREADFSRHRKELDR